MLQFRTTVAAHLALDIVCSISAVWCCHERQYEIHEIFPLLTLPTASIGGKLSKQSSGDGVCLGHLRGCDVERWTWKTAEASRLKA